MKTALAIVAAIITLHLIPALIVTAMPQWMQTAAAIYLLAILPIHLFIKAVRWSYKQLEGKN